MPGQVRPRESCTTGGGHAGDHVGVGDDQAVVRHEAGAGGGVAALLCGAQESLTTEAAARSSAADSTVWVGRWFRGAMSWLTSGMVPEGEHVIAYRVDAVLTTSGVEATIQESGLGVAGAQC